MRKSSVALLLVFLTAVGIALVSLRAQEETLPGTAPRSQFVPYYQVGGGYTTTLMMSNTTRGAFVVRPTLYSLDGQPARLDSIPLAAHETRAIDLADWVVGLGPEFRSGSLRLDYRSVGNGLGAMITMANEVRSVQVTFMAKSPRSMKSGRLESLWRVPGRNSRLSVVISNTSGLPVNGVLTLTDARGALLRENQLRLDSHQTRRFEVHDLIGLAANEIGGLSISHNGLPGSVVAHGFVLDPSSGFSLNLPFEDPETFGDSKLEGAGVLLGPSNQLPAHPQFTGYLLLRNISASPVKATPILQHGEVQQPLPPVELAPGETKEVRIRPQGIPDVPEPMGIEITHSGPPDAVLGQWFSVDRAGSLVVETPLRNVAPNAVTAGTHPWSLEGDRSAILHIMNTGDRKASFLAAIHHSGGTYILGRRELAAHEVESIDIRKLRDEQSPDANGLKLPPDVSHGHMVWFWQAGPPLVGRVNVMSLTRGIAENMSCPGCCCANDRYYSMLPATVTVGTGSQATFTVYENTFNCNGFFSYPASPADFDWFSSNQNVATVNTGVATCASPGHTTITATYLFWPFDIYIDASGPEDCNCIVETGDPNATSSLNVRPTITGPNTVWYFGGSSPSGYATQITLSSSGGSSTTWSVISGSNKVNLSSTTGAQVNVTSSGSAFSSSVGDVQVKATTAGIDSLAFSITTRTPHRLVAGSISTSCDATYGYQTDINYAIKDQLSADLPADVPVNEKWSTSVVNDYAGATWRRGPEGWANSLQALFLDQIQGEASGFNPTPTCDGNSTPVQHWGQDWWIGSSQIGAGRRVQTNTLQKYLGRAAHTSITTPAP